MTIHKFVLEKTERGYTVTRYELMTEDTLRDMATSLWLDGMYSEAKWYDARARETGKTGKAQWFDMSSNFNSYGFDLTSVEHDMINNARSKGHCKHSGNTWVYYCCIY